MGLVHYAGAQTVFGLMIMMGGELIIADADQGTAFYY